MVGVAKVGPDNFFDCICEGMSSQTQPSHTFRPTSDTPPVSFADSPLGEGAWIYWIFANLMTLPALWALPPLGGGFGKGSAGEVQNFS